MSEKKIISLDNLSTFKNEMDKSITKATTMVINNLTDVNINNATSGDFLVYNSETSKWENKDVFIPTALSELSDDDSHRLVTEDEKDKWNDRIRSVPAVDFSEAEDPVFLQSLNTLHETVLEVSAPVTEREIRNSANAALEELS